MVQDRTILTMADE